MGFRTQDLLRKAMAFKRQSFYVGLVPIYFSFYVKKKKKDALGLLKCRYQNEVLEYRASH